MGYLTKGRWLIKGPADTMQAAWTAIKLDPPSVMLKDYKATDLLGDFTLFTQGETGYLRFSFEDWKWYHTYDDVQFYEAVWNELMAYFGDAYIELNAVTHFDDHEPQPQEN